MHTKCADELAKIASALQQQASKTGEVSKLTELRLKYAYDYFSFHAKQRTTMFNFFMVAVGLIATAVAQSFKDGMPKEVLIGLLVIGAILTIAFIFLDRRNVQLLQIAGDVLREIEETTLFKDIEDADSPGRKHTDKGYIPLAILWRQRREKEANLWCRATIFRRHGLWILVVQLVIFSGFVGGVWYANTSSYDSQSPKEVHAIKFLAAPNVTVTIQGQPGSPSAYLTPATSGAIGKDYGCSKPKTAEINNFLPGDSSLPSDTDNELSKILVFAAQCPEHNVEIQGYRDFHDKNVIQGMHLSSERAERVKEYLMTNPTQRIKSEKIMVLPVWEQATRQVVIDIHAISSQAIRTAQ